MTTESMGSPDVTRPIVGIGALATMIMIIDCASQEIINKRSEDTLLCTLDIAGKKMKRPAGKMSAGNSGDQENPGLHRGGKVLLEQMWDLKGCRGVQVHSDTSVSNFYGKSVFLPPKEWVRIFFPYKLHIEGGFIVICGLQRPGIVG